MNGERNRRVKLYRQVVTKSQSGEEKESFELHSTRWAKVTYGAGSERHPEKGREAYQEAAFEINWLPGIQETWYFEHQGRNYHILAIHEIGRREGLTCKCERRDNDR